MHFFLFVFLPSADIILHIMFHSISKTSINCHMRFVYNMQSNSTVRLSEAIPVIELADSKRQIDKSSMVSYKINHSINTLNFIYL